jgi:predicted CXXCH cytochrome family protein
MFLEIAFCAVLLLFGTAPLIGAVRTQKSARLIALATAVILLPGGAVLAWKRFASAQHQRIVQESVPRLQNTGYVRSERCQACHPREYTTWHDSFHRTMTQVATPETMLGKFENTELLLKGDRYRFFREGDDYSIEMTDLRWKAQRHPTGQSTAKEIPPRIKYPVRMLTGKHHMQALWIVPEGFGNLQLVAPFAWLNEEQRWVPFHQTFLRDPSFPIEPQVWNGNCINCHSTGPIPRRNLENSMCDTRVGELGISCEACHGPAEEHIRSQQNPLVRYAAHRAKTDKNAHPDDFIVNPAKLPPKRSAQVCGQCHGIHWRNDPREWNEHGTPFRPGRDLEPALQVVQPAEAHDQPWAKRLLEQPRFARDRYWSDGMVRVSGREFNGLQESPCYKKGDLTCISCHAMHNSEPDDQLAPRMESNEACLQCHSGFKSNVTAHTHHSGDSSGSLCYNCHMPYTTYGLLKGIRSHQISSPDVVVTQKTGRPNACNGCHLDKPLGWTADYLGKWFQQKMPPLSEEERTRSSAALYALKGDAGQRALTAYAMGWEDARKTSGADWLVPYLASLLDDPYSAVRYIAYRSLRGHSGFKDLKFDFTQAPADRPAMLPKILDLWKAAPGGEDRSGESILLKAPRQVDTTAFEQLAAQRDNTSIDLQE